MLAPPEIRYEPYSSQEHCNFGVVYEESGDLKRAERQYSWAIRKDAENYIAHTNLGNVASREGRWEASEASYRRALIIKPDYLPARNNLAVLLMEKRMDPLGAAELLEPYANNLPTEMDVEILDTLSNAYRRSSNDTKAAYYKQRSEERRKARDQEQLGRSAQPAPADKGDEK